MDSISQQNIFNNIVILVHFVLYILVIFSPFYISQAFKNNYKNCISAFMITVVISWSIFGKCIVTIFEGSSRNGVINTFFYNILGLPISPIYERIVDLLGGFLFVLVALYYCTHGRKILISIFYFFFLITTLFYNTNKISF
tara:strand:- start:1260 stop:1682 length:423 start_codon:yes stop_codon:yes gene_type:complete